MSYVDYNYYANTYGGSAITAEEAPRALQRASNSVDSLTYCRITSRDLESLTSFQSDIVKRVVCMLAEWQHENADLLTNPYSSYSVNGVSATWGAGAAVRRVNGVMIPHEIYAELVKSGLCYAGV